MSDGRRQHMTGINTTGRHPSTQQIARWFEYGHLMDTGPRAVSAEIFEVAEWLTVKLPDSAEVVAGLRHLLEAKDCFVRAAIAAQQDSGGDAAGEA